MATVFAGQYDIYNKYVFASIENRKIFNELLLVHSDNPKAHSIGNFSYKLYRHFTIGGKSNFYLEANGEEYQPMWIPESDTPNQLADSLYKLICAEFEKEC